MTTATNVEVQVAPVLTAVPKFVGTTEPSTIKKGCIWKDGQHYVTITNVDGDLVEYGYPSRRDVFYLTQANFRRQFTVIPAGHTFNKKERDTLMAELRKCLEEIKAKNLGDQVYFMMDQFGL